MKYFLGIDLGGTMIKAAVINEQYKIISHAEGPTGLPRAWEKILDDCVLVAREATKCANMSIDDFSYIGVGGPGIIDVDTGIIKRAVNLGFYDVPIKAYLEKKINIPVFVENDANAAAYGEFIAGSGQEFGKFPIATDKPLTDLISITIGTGIGAGIILDGKIFRGSNGFAGELGHTVIKLDGRACPCGRKGCMNMYASASGLIHTTREFMKNHSNSALWQEAGDLKGVDACTAFRTAEKGDAVAKKILEHYIVALGAGLVNMVNIFQPQIITISGGVSKEGENLLAPLRAIAEKECLKGVHSSLPIICTGKLQDTAGVIGAAILKL